MNLYPAMYYEGITGWQNDTIRLTLAPDWHPTHMSLSRLLQANFTHMYPCPVEVSLEDMFKLNRGGGGRVLSGFHTGGTCFEENIVRKQDKNFHSYAQYSNGGSQSGCCLHQCFGSLITVANQMEQSIFCRPSLTSLIIKIYGSKDLEWDLFCFNDTFFTTNTTTVNDS